MGCILLTSRIFQYCLTSFCLSFYATIILTEILTEFRNFREIPEIPKRTGNSGQKPGNYGLFHISDVRPDKRRHTQIMVKNTNIRTFFVIEGKKSTLEDFS